jgi:hypothetical protein
MTSAVAGTQGRYVLKFCNGVQFRLQCLGHPSIEYCPTVVVKQIPTLKNECPAYIAMDWHEAIASQGGLKF